jgi:hypothetical protein
MKLMGKFYAVCVTYPAIPWDGIEIEGFRLTLPEAFALLMSKTVSSYRFARDHDGVLRLMIKENPEKDGSECDPGTASDCMTSSNADDELARDEIMLAAGKKLWHGRFIVEYEEPMASPEQLRAELLAHLETRAA